MVSGSVFLGSHSESLGKYGKIEHENGFKIGFSFKNNILL